MLKSNSCSDIEPILPIKCDDCIIDERFIISKTKMVNTFKNFSHRDKVKVRKILKEFKK